MCKNIKFSLLGKVLWLIRECQSQFTLLGFLSSIMLHHWHSHTSNVRGRKWGESTQEEVDLGREEEGPCFAGRQHGGDTSVAVLTFSSVEPGYERKPLGPQVQSSWSSDGGTKPPERPTSALCCYTGPHLLKNIFPTLLTLPYRLFQNPPISPKVSPY